MENLRCSLRQTGMTRPAIDTIRNSRGYPIMPAADSATHPVKPALPPGGPAKFAARRNCASIADVRPPARTGITGPRISGSSGIRRNKTDWSAGPGIRAHHRLRYSQRPSAITASPDWNCERGDSNSYALRHQILSLARLPIPPLSLRKIRGSGKVSGTGVQRFPEACCSFLPPFRAAVSNIHGDFQV